MNYVPIVVATDLEVHFSVLKKGVSQYFCLYSLCTSHWCLVMSFWLKVCIYICEHVFACLEVFRGGRGGQCHCYLQRMCSEVTNVVRVN